MSGHTYSLLNFNCAISGPGGVVSLGSGAGSNEEGITFTYLESQNNMEVGPDGTGQHSLNANKSARCELRLLKTSTTNAVLMAMANFQLGSPANHGQNNISGVDTISGDTVTCQQVAFVKRPDMKQQGKAGIFTWIFDIVTMDLVLGLGR